MTLDRYIDAKYVSVFDDSITCESTCIFDRRDHKVIGIEPAENAEEADSANGLTDEYVVLPDGTELREDDGVRFIY